MGPDNLPSRPRFHCDIRNTPWTDGKGPQDEYFAAVKLWKFFHDNLEISNSNKIPQKLQGIVLLSQIYGRATNLVKKVPQEDVESEDGAMHVARAIHKRDLLSVVTDTFHRYLELMRTKQGDNETFKNFETRFDSQVSRFNASCKGSELPPALFSFLLLANSRIDTSQRISIISSALPRETDIVDKEAKDILAMIKYDDIATVVRACDEPKKLLQTPRASHVMAVTTVSSPRYHRKKRQKQRLNPEQLADLKSKSICRICKKKGHWASDQEPCRSADAKQIFGNRNSDAAETKISGGSANDRKGILHFNMVSLSSSRNSIEVPGPLVDDAAPYSGLGIVELQALHPQLIPEWDGTLEDIPDSVKDRPFWQYGSGEHASPRRRILGSVIFSTLSDQGTPMKIRHLVMEGSSQWLIDRNVTCSCIINHATGNYLEFYVSDSETNNLSMTDFENHSYLPASVFMRTEQNSLKGEPLYTSALVSLSCSANYSQFSWPDTKKIIDKVHRHVCGHSSYNDIKLLMERNELWDDQCSKYLSQLLETCPHCPVVQLPSPSRKVSLSSMSRQFNAIVCIDHLFLDGHDVLHMMDSRTRYSTGLIVPSTSMREAIIGYESKWLFEFWPSDAVQIDQAFNNSEFKIYLSLYDINYRPVPPRRHSKNVLESKHRILRDIFLRLQSAFPMEDTRMIVSKIFRVSNDLYGNNVASSHELSKGYTRPIIHDFPRNIPPEILKAQEALSAKLKLNLILSSKSTAEPPVHVGDYVQIFVKLQGQKRGSWSDPTPVLAYDPESRIVTVPGAYGRTRQAAIEDTRLAVCDNELASEIQREIDELSADIDTQV